MYSLCAVVVTSLVVSSRRSVGVALFRLVSVSFSVAERSSLLRSCCLTGGHIGDRRGVVPSSRESSAHPVPSVVG